MNFKDTEWYRTGGFTGLGWPVRLERVNIRNGAAIVTGVGTNWLIAEVKAGDIFTLDGSQLYEIASVTSSTELNLKTRYQGESVEGQSYAIIFHTHAVMQAEIAERLEYVVNEWQERDAKLDALYRAIDLTVPVSAWTESSEGTGQYNYYADLTSDLITSGMTPIVTVYPASAKTAEDAGLYNFAMTLDKTLRLYASIIPEQDINISAVFLGSGSAAATPENIPVASETTAGVIKAGRGLNIESDGTANVDVDDEVVGDEMNKLTATNEQVINILDKYFGEK